MKSINNSIHHAATFPLRTAVLSILAVACANQSKMDLNTAGKDILRHPVCLRLNCSRTINNGSSRGNDCRDRGHGMVKSHFEKTS
ncbi:uncharacterized [Tachysurus ichikawai]